MTRSPHPWQPPRPHRYSRPQLETVLVEILDFARVQLRCMRCRAVWSPNLQPGGWLPRGYWRCPHGCNSPEAFVRYEHEHAAEIERHLAELGERPIGKE